MKKLLFLTVIVAAFSAPLLAQPSMELTPTFGYVFGGSFDELTAPGLGNVSVDVEDSESYGLIFDIGSPANQFEFTWMRQETNLATNADEFPSFDYQSDNYQLGFIHNFHAGEPTTPFFIASMGWTDFDIAGQSSDERFSVAIGGGVKHYFNERIGVRAQARWIPTYVNTDDAYVVCDPWGFCYAVGDDNYLYQTEISLGLVIKIR